LWSKTPASAFAIRSLGQLTADLAAALKADPSLWSQLEQHLFDAGDFYGSSPQTSATNAAMLNGGQGNVVWNTQAVRAPTASRDASSSDGL